MWIEIYFFGFIDIESWEKSFGVLAKKQSPAENLKKMNCTGSGMKLIVLSAAWTGTQISADIQHEVSGIRFASSTLIDPLSVFKHQSLSKITLSFIVFQWHLFRLLPSGSVDDVFFFHSHSFRVFVKGTFISLVRCPVPAITHSAHTEPARTFCYLSCRPHLLIYLPLPTRVSITLLILPSCTPFVTFRMGSNVMVLLKL